MHLIKTRVLLTKPEVFEQPPRGSSRLREEKRRTPHELLCFRPAELGHNFRPDKVTRPSDLQSAIQTSGNGGGARSFENSWSCGNSRTRSFGATLQKPGWMSMPASCSVSFGCTGLGGPC